jgi:hypothetical protein
MEVLVVISDGRGCGVDLRVPKTGAQCHVGLMRIAMIRSER